MTTPVPPEPTPAPPAEPPADKTFTQADLDRIVADRLARQKAQFGDYEALKTKAAQFDELAEQSKTEAEKAVAAARKEGFTEAQQKANDQLKKALIRAEAAGVLANPALAERLIDLSQFTAGDDGEFDRGAFKAAVEQLANDEPYLAAQSSGFQGSGGGGPRGARPGTPPTLAQQIAEAERSGNTRQAIRLKSAQLMGLRNQKG